MRRLPGFSARSGPAEQPGPASWAGFAPTYNTGALCVSVPGIVTPYSPGEATLAFCSDGLATLNLGRYLAELPVEVSLLPSTAGSGSSQTVTTHAFDRS